MKHIAQKITREAAKDPVNPVKDACPVVGVQKKGPREGR